MSTWPTSDPAEGKMPGQVEANRDAINEVLQQVGRAYLLPSSLVPRA